MSRHALSVIVLGGLLISSPAWAIPQASACRSHGSVHRSNTFDARMCLLLQDPWQDCNEDPWQLSTLGQTEETFSDPWQDSADPWQPFTTLAPQPATDESSIDPWQPPVSQLAPVQTAELAEDPWQPTFEDPWQEGAVDPWQVP